MRSRLRALALLLAALWPTAAEAEWSEFLPKGDRNGAFVDFFASYEKDHSGALARGFQWDDNFLKEKLTVYSNGYVYHPRFLQYYLSLSGAAKQESFEQSSLPPPGRQSDTGLEYEGRLYVLPEHAGNLQLFALRYEPLFKERTSSHHDSVQTSRGASFRYRKKPYFLHARYVDNSLDSGFSSSDVSRLGVDGQYFKRYKSGKQFSLNAGFSPSHFHDSLGLSGDKNQALFGANFSTRWLRLTGNLNRDDFSQGQALARAQDLTSRQVSGYGLATAYLPKGFRTDLTYRHVDNESTIPVAAGQPSRTLQDKGDDVQLDVVHKLYQSLDSAYRFLHGFRGSVAGDTHATAHALNFSYAKTIPRGRVIATINAGRADTDNSGRADVASEPHPGLHVPGSFNLIQRDVDPGSVAVFLRSPFPPFEDVRLLEGAHYTLATIGNALQITVLALPAEFVVPGSYEFLVSYSLLSGNFALRSDAFGSNLSVELLDTLLTPYAGYAAVRGDVTAGVFPGGALDSTTYTAGLLLHRGPLRARGEHQRIEWDVSPWRGWRFDLQYVGALNPTTSVYATASYTDKQYLQGVSSSRPGYNDEIANASGSIRRQFFTRRMIVSAGGTYSHLSGLSQGNGYSLNGALSWRLGQLTVEAGANAYSGNAYTAGVQTTDRDHQYYYLKVRRNLSW